MKLHLLIHEYTTHLARLILGLTTVVTAGDAVHITKGFLQVRSKHAQRLFSSQSASKFRIRTEQDATDNTHSEILLL